MAILRGKKIIIIILFAVTLIALEVILRKVWGFGEMSILFQEDTAFEYIAKPNQNKRRFGNNVIYNEYSMRSGALRQDDECVIMGFGDSVFNGGTLTDHDSMASTIVEKQLQKAKNGSRFLNVSAPSWGPDNCAAYLAKHGSFNAKMIVLFVSSHDAHDNMTFEKIVGTHQSYPDKAYSFAIQEVIVRYIAPRILRLINPGEKANDLMINKNGIGFNPGFDFFKDFTQRNKIPFLVCLHAESEEVRAGNFNPQGEEIIRYCAANNIRVISGLQIGEELSDFVDGIHINEKGQKRWAKVLFTEIEKTIKPCS